MLAYGLSFVYGATGSTDLATIAAAAAAAGLCSRSAWSPRWPASAFKIAAFPFHMWVPDTYEAASHARSWRG